MEEKFAIGTAKIHWDASKGQLLPLVFEPAVLTRVAYPTNALKLVPALEALAPKRRNCWRWRPARWTSRCSTKLK